MTQRPRDRLAAVSCYSCRRDPRFCYHVYLPRSFGSSRQPERYPVIALVHGDERGAENYRNSFKKFAERLGLAIIAPLFPAGIQGQGGLDGYNMLRWGDIDYGQIFEAMLGEFGERFPVDTGGIALHGFSSGGQFAHRFLYLYPELLRCVSIGAPGYITFPRRDRDWPDGVGNLTAVFGREARLEEMRRVPVQIVIGGEDNKPPSRDPDGPSRIELNRLLLKSYQDMGVPARLDVVPGADHNGLKLLDPIMAFFEESCAPSKL